MTQFYDPATRYPLREPWSHPWSEDGPERLTHLTFLDGRLVHARSEPVRFTEWEELAERWDQRARTPVVPFEPPRPVWQRALDWLADRVGGEHALEVLSTTPLAEVPLAEVDGLGVASSEVRQQLAEVVEHLDVLAERRPEPELRAALQAAAVQLVRDHAWHRVAGAPVKVAAGIGWAVLKANAVLRPAGDVRVSWVQDVLELPGSPATTGKQVQDALYGFRHRTREVVAPIGLPDLLPLGRPEVLTGATRRLLADARDRAVEAREAAGVLPLTVESSECRP